MEHLVVILNVFSSMAHVVAISVVYFVRREFRSKPLDYLLAFICLGSLNQITLMVHLYFLNNTELGAPLLELLFLPLGSVAMIMEYFLEFSFLKSILNRPLKRSTLSMFSLVFSLSLLQSYSLMSKLLGLPQSPAWLHRFFQYSFGILLVVIAIMILRHSSRCQGAKKTALVSVASIELFLSFSIYGIFAALNLKLISYSEYEIIRNLIQTGILLAIVFFVRKLSLALLKDSPVNCNLSPEFPGLNQPLLREFKITPREKEVTALIVGGLSNQEIAEKLFISLATVKDHNHRIYRKAGVKNRVQLTNLMKDTSPSN